LFRCLNATTGAEIWTILNYGNDMGGGVPAIAEGYLAILNTYMEQVEVFGRGPSQLTVSAPQASIELGKSLVITGTVADISAGTKQDEQAARFPSGVAAVSDDSMKSWMEYVYMQKPRPTDVTGVPITLSVVDANGNYREIGTVTSSDGFYSLTWKPDIDGQYSVYASFGGSESYWPSHALTAFAVDTAPATVSPQPQVIIQSNEMYTIGIGIAIIVTIAIVGAILLVAIRKRS
jgi:hypothetical protein